jgi:hypothetical protein
VRDDGFPGSGCRATISMRSVEMSRSESLQGQEKRSRMRSPQKTRISETFERLPDAYKQEVLDFVEFLARKAEIKKEEVGSAKVPDGENPFRAFIGAVEDGRLAEGIDEALYG